MNATLLNSLAKNKYVLNAYINAHIAIKTCKTVFINYAVLVYLFSYDTTKVYKFQITS